MAYWWLSLNDKAQEAIIDWLQNAKASISQTFGNGRARVSDLVFLILLASQFGPGIRSLRSLSIRTKLE